MSDTPTPTAQEQVQYGVLVPLLRSLALAVLVSAGTVGALAFVQTWEGAPNFGIATYLFWPMLSGALTLLARASRFSPVE